jgi:hypothetical protein
MVDIDHFCDGHGWSWRGGGDRRESYEDGSTHCR